MMSTLFRGRVGRLLGFLLLLTAIVGGAGVFFVRMLAREFSQLASENLQASVQLSNAERALWNLRFALPNYVLTDAKGRQAINASAAGYIQEARDNLAAFEASPSRSDEERELLKTLHRKFGDYIDSRPHYFELVDAGKLEEAKVFRAEKTNPPAAETVRAMELLIEIQQTLGNEHEVSARRTAWTANAVMVGLVIAALALGIFLGRAFSREIADAMLGLKRSSAGVEEAAVGLQSGARELSAAAATMNATLAELLAASRQISEAGHRVADVAAETGSSAQSGDSVAQNAGNSLAMMRERMAEIVKSMGLLDQSSQEIDGVVDIIDELSQQTNILSINATIEAAGAGQAGARFAVVANEIRKLADRVGTSAHGIRDLTRGVYEAIIMTRSATSEGARAVEGSMQQFTEVLETFRGIRGKVKATTQAAREIEVSTKQQTTAVAQVSAAMSELARSAHEAEVSIQQMMQTCAQLRGIENQLGNLTGA